MTPMTPLAIRMRRRSALLRARRGFSLVELTIVIGVIIILVSLVLAVSTIVIAKNEERSTASTLAILDAAVKEWERQVDHRVTFPQSLAESNATGTTWDIPWDPALNTISGSAESSLPAIYKTTQSGEPNFLEFQRFVWLVELITQQPDCREMLAKIPEDSFHRIRVPSGSTYVYYNLKEITDAWGTPLLAVFPGRDWTSSDAANLQDLDGTIKTPLEQSLGLSCRNKQVLFVSAGADQKFLNASATTEDERADNIYSYGQQEGTQ